MIALGVPKLKMFSPDSEIFLRIKQEMFFCDEPVRLFDHKVLRPFHILIAD